MPAPPRQTGRNTAVGSPVRIPSFQQNGATFDTVLEQTVIDTFAAACTDAGLADDCITLEFRITNPRDGECSFNAKSVPTLVEAPAHVIIGLNGSEPCPVSFDEFEVGTGETEVGTGETEVGTGEVDTSKPTQQSEADG